MATATAPDPTALYQEILDARERISRQAHVTPVLTSRTLDERLGARVFLKCENLQRTGAFKFRGAFNAISKLTDEERARGVITFSSGNHAQAVALVGRLLGAAVTVVMPHNAPATKRAATEGYGAGIVPYDPDETAREGLARELQEKHGLTLVPPFDHLDVIAGQGTAAAELIDEVGELDQFLAPVGGGGLLSGCATACHHMAPGCRVIGIEPELADDAARSFRTGELQRVENSQTIADGTRPPCLGDLTFPLILQLADDMRTVSEESIMEAVRFLFYRMKIVVEPSGALGIAALLSGVVEAEGRIGVLISGGNVDGEMMGRILGDGGTP